MRGSDQEALQRGWKVGDPVMGRDYFIDQMARKHSPGMKRSHRKLCSRLSDRLPRDDSNGLSQRDKFSFAKIPSITELTNSTRKCAFQW